ncbi:hypothetical protein [Vibrio cholerae]|uniref:hypothetical protein n=1 Tax=Vibrio cholerae TaxID=666 RepID=UPI001C30606D
MKIEIIKGDFSGETWSLEKDRIEAGFYKIKQIPISEIVELKKIEVTKKEHFVEFILADGKSFVASMKQKTYESCYKKFIELGNQSKSLDLPVLRKSKLNVFWSVLSLLILVRLLSSGEAEKELDTSEKVILCKAYIGKLFGRPENIIDNYKNSDGLVFVRYIRASDNTAWSYACEVSGGRMIWAAWLTDEQRWGRWRYEDEVTLKYDETTKKMSFFMPKNHTGELVEVQL